MPKPRKKLKHATAHTPPRKRQRASEDWLGKFLLTSLPSLVTALVSLAQNGRVDWSLVFIVFFASLLLLVLYETRR